MIAKPMINPLDGAHVVLCARDAEEVEPIAELLGNMGCAVQPAETTEELDELLEKKAVDVILVHVCPSRREFLTILDRPGLPPVVPLLCHADKHLYMETLRLGAFDCVPLPAHSAELKRVLTLALAEEKRKKDLATSNAA